MRSSSKNKDDESNGSKKKLVNGTGSTARGSGTSDMYGLRRSTRDFSSNKQFPASPQSTRKSGRLVKSKSVSPVINRKSVRIHKQLTPSPLRRSDRGKKQISSGSSGSKKSEKASASIDLDQMKAKRERSLNQLTLEVNISDDVKPASGKRQALDGRTFRALFKTQRGQKTAADRSGINSSERDGIVEETLANAEKLLVESSRDDEQLQTREVASSELIRKSHDDVIDIECGDIATLSKRKRYMIMDLDASVVDARKDVCTLSSDDIHSSSRCKTHNVFETCATCSKRQRVDHDAHGQDFCSCSTVLAKASHEINIIEDMGQPKAIAPTESVEKCGSRVQLKEIRREIQTVATESRCVICRLGGKLMFCDGRDCKTSCHPSCLDPSTDDVPAGVWHCFQCLNNKMQAGACSLSESVEAIWNAREAEFSDAEGLRKEKQYFVKYRGLAHIHNQWIPESQLLLEAEELIEEFNKKREVVKWNEEWVVPQRLLKKRLLSSPKQENAAAGTSSYYCEWLVKWRGLDYESVTWELDTFLSSVLGQNLIKEYENRHKNALDDPSSVDKDKNWSLVKLQKLPDRSPPGLGTSYLDTLNKLREFGHKGQSAVVFDDQDRIMKTLLYILSLSDVCQPFLIVTTPSLLPVWESEFLRAAPSIDVVVYDGSSDNRKSIRTLEFYDQGGRIMLQVLLSSVEIVVEDLLFLESIKWKVVIVDECQESEISSQFEQIKMLTDDVKILLYRGPLKDNVTEYFNLLALLDSSGDSINFDVPKAESSEKLCKLKERLSQYIACEFKSSSSKFVEFWVPSMISNVQLEQYCDILLSKSISLCSYSKTDPVGALRDIVVSSRKSCDHPYIVDPSLKILITKDLPPINFLDVEIKASGKLQLLEMILSEIKKRQLRVLILFQSVAGSGRDTLGLGDILDDFLRERFGVDTYERVDGGAISSKSRQTALNNFNKESGRFMFLLENRACLASIRLVSVDTIIIFGSDWNPANDVKALNKITIESQFKQIKIFRLYSAFTVEEKVLILAKQGLTLESNLENISRATSNMLLMWGASYLLNRLDEYHSTPDANVSSEQTLSSKVVDQIFALLPQNGECDGVDNYPILKIQQKGGIYSSNLKLLGEQQVQSSDGEHPHNFWTNLLNGRNPKWKFLSGKTQRHRKKVQYFDDSRKKAECEAVEVGKKRKKGGSNCITNANFNPGPEQDKAEGGVSDIPGDYGFCCLKKPDASATKLFQTSKAPITVSEKSTLPDEQKSLQLLVKPDILKLCEILKLSDGVKIMVERFLEYVISNHQVKSDSANILQAFLISLCWSSASLLKQKVDRKESLLLAKQHLNFSCNEKEADSVYSAVRKLKKAFKENLLSDFSKDSISGVGKFQKGTLQNVKPELKEIGDQVHTDQIAQDDETHKVDTENNYKLIQRKCRKRIAKVIQKQEEEFKKLNIYWEVQRVEIENKQKVESAIIREMYSHKPLRTEKLKTLDNECMKKLEELEREKEISLKQLKAKQLDALSDESRKVTQWLNSAASCATEVSGQDELPLHRSGVQNEVGYSQAGEHVSPNVSENDATMSRHHVESHGDNDRVGGVSADTPNVLENHSQSGESNSSAAVDSSSTEMFKLPENQRASSPACNQVEIPALQLLDAKKVNQPNHDTSLVGRPAHVKQPQLEQSTASLSGRSPTDLPLASGSAPRPLNERDTPPQSAEAFQLSENATVLSGQGFFLTSQIVEENPLTDDRVRHLADKQGEIPQQMVEQTTEFPNQVLPHLGGNVELHLPADVITPIQQKQPDFPSTSTLDHQPLILNTSFLNSEAVPQFIDSTTELPRQAVNPAGVNMSVLGFNDLPLRTEHQVPSRIPKLTSYSDPLQNELEAIRKETEQAIKLHEDVKTRLKSEVEELIAQLHREYEAKIKDAEAAFLLKKKELHKNHNKVFMNKILADAFRSKCVEVVHPGPVQHLNQLPSHAAPRSAGQPAASQQNTAPMSQPASRLHPIIVSSTARQSAANQQNMTLPIQGTQFLPVTATSSCSQPAAAKQQATTLLMQPELGNNFVSVSSSAGQPAAIQQYTSPLLQSSPRISPISVSSLAAQPATSQQSTPPLQIVHQSAALFSSTPTRPPQINPITPSTGNLRVGNESRARAPAPHLQAFRSASSPVNVTSTQRVMPSHLNPSSLPTSSSHPLPPAPPTIPPNYSSASRLAQSNIAKDMLPHGLLTPSSASVSRQELLKESHKQQGAQRLDDDPPLPDLGSKLDSIDLSVFETGPSLPPNSVAADLTTKAVCLSDEE